MLFVLAGGLAMLAFYAGIYLTARPDPYEAKPAGDSDPSSDHPAASPEAAERGEEAALAAPRR